MSKISKKMKVYDPSKEMLEIITNKKIIKLYPTDVNQETPLKKIAYVINGDTLPIFKNRLTLEKEIKAWLLKKGFTLNIILAPDSIKIKVALGSVFIMDIIQDQINDEAGVIFEVFDKLLQEFRKELLM